MDLHSKMTLYLISTMTSPFTKTKIINGLGFIAKVLQSIGKKASK